MSIKGLFTIIICVYLSFNTYYKNADSPTKLRPDSEYNFIQSEL